MKKGKVYFVGAGPSGRDLITLKGWRVLQQAEVVIYDYLVDKGLLADIGTEAELICCDALRKKRHSDGFCAHQENINALMVLKVKEGKKVVRLKNGDPFIFGRASEEMEVLTKNKIEFEVVPGVSAGQAAACFSGIPLTERGSSSSVVFVTGHEAEGKEKSAIDWGVIARVDTVVLYMAVENISAVAAGLIQAGKPQDTPVAAVFRAGGIEQRDVIATLKDIPAAIKKAGIGAPAILIIGNIVSLEKKFNWRKHNKRILFTGLAEERFFEKGTYMHLPLIAIKPLEDYTAFDSCLRGIGGFDWILFTSRYAVQYSFARLTLIGLDTRALHAIRIAAIGNSTAKRLLDFGVKADLIPKRESSQGIIAALKKSGVKNKRIFMPRSDLSDKGITQELIKLGAIVNTAVAYRNIMPQDLPDFDLSSFDEIVFTSPSGVRNFVTRYGLPPEKAKIRCIGEVTRLQAEKLKVV